MVPEKIRFLHCADIHMDIPFCDNGNKGYSDMRNKDLRKTFEGIIELSKAEKVDFVLICGDLYEHRHTSRHSVEWMQSILGSLPVPVVIVPGNHDPLTANSWYKTREWPKNVVILSNENPSVKLDNLGTFIHGVGFSAFRQDKPDFSHVPGVNPGLFNILMLHGTLDMDIGKPFNPVSSIDLERLGYDYYALGHFHNRFVGLRLKNAANPGSPEPLGFDEKDNHGVFIVTMGRAAQGQKEFALEQRNTAQRRYVEPVLDITPLRSVDEIRGAIAELLEGYDAERDLVRIILKGRTGCMIDCRKLEASLSAGRVFLKIRNEAQNSLNYENLAAEESLKGAFVREMLSRMKNSEEKGRLEDIPVLSAALDFGIEALEDGLIDVRFEGEL